MANVISLGDRRPRTPRPIAKEPMEAKILLFTGVRYERLEFVTPRPRSGAKRAKTK
ncbi:hypothetical protein [Rhizobium tubonense]|uniref:hypothetical protein n=1 Tax=Rhizobium tubonense TaxID=484088 RepID=UPI0018A8283D|nr:hypothetical protein [Rhizobium tubonense]